ncbi:ABC transporter ATP-binding protein [Empedobacter tilapiae]|uniref:ABC transporter ATP-binding protein n=1 Tax=Empedobacter tilapiae TaxID=2491114 RepID=UPI0028D340A7|nr:ABC transporter ATP-binding protein [Empedobacter tilapiae]
MSKNIVLDVENVSKQYRLGEVGTASLQHDIKRWWANVRGKEDPYLKIGETNDRTQKGDSDYVWALRDINFQVEQGQAVGIIGRNGAGKSTLLKLLSRVTKPTTGSIKYKGRIASLLEVGTGFHPEMTGRENIYLNGAILGMTRKEITRKFDEIVDFAGVERYIDTPVKRYSSGMYVRLAFAVAAHLESEILIVDEVLAVGDAEFQKKCLGKMGDVSKGEGRTVLFVSHNMSSVKTLCNNGILLEHGKINHIGDIDTIINKYNINTYKDKNYKYEVVKKSDKSHIQSIVLCDKDGNQKQTVDSLIESYFLKIKIYVEDSYNLNFGCTILNVDNEPLISFPVYSNFESYTLNEIKIRIPSEVLIAGEYLLEGALWNNHDGKLESNDCYMLLKIEPRHQLELFGDKIKGKIMSSEKWI